MNWYRLTLRLRSALITPIRGDTLWGHVCWGIVGRSGEPALLEFLAGYATGQPPLILSNGFPAGSLPLPQLAPRRPPRTATKSDYARSKRLKKQPYADAEAIVSGAYGSPNSKPRVVPALVSTNHMHNSIDRLSGTVADEGGLFHTQETWPARATGLFDLYALSPLGAASVRAWIADAVAPGYGADSSTGRGVLSIETIDDYTPPAAGERLLCLGDFVPGPDEKPPDLRAAVLTKYGRIGGDFVYSMLPFKKPLIMFREGATFEFSPGVEYTGCLLDGIHADGRIKQHAFCPVLPIAVPSEG